MLKKPLCIGLVGCLAGVGLTYYWVSNRKRRRIIQLKRNLDKQLAAGKQNVRVIFCENEDSWKEIENAFVKTFEANNVAGFDCEWVTPRESGGKTGKIALVQIAFVDGTCYLIRTCNFRVLPKPLVAFLMDKSILKLGVGIQDDDKKTRNDFGVSVRGFVDLRHFVLRFRPELTKRGLAGLAMAFLDLKLDKDWRIRAGDWEAETFSQRQIDYAVNDALTAVNIAYKIVIEDLEKPWRVDLGLSPLEMIFKMFRPFREVPYKDVKIKGRKWERKQNGIGQSNSGKTKEPGRENKKKSHSLRKTPLYHNAKLQAPDGQPLCVCDVRKAEWYISKGLGAKVADDPFTVQLKFEPKGRPEVRLESSIKRSDLIFDFLRAHPESIT